MPRPPQGRPSKPARSKVAGRVRGLLAARTAECALDLSRTFSEFKGSSMLTFIPIRFDLDDRLALALSARDRGDRREERKLLKAWATPNRRAALISRWIACSCPETARKFGWLVPSRHTQGHHLSISEGRIR